MKIYLSAFLIALLTTCGGGSDTAITEEANVLPAAVLTAFGADPTKTDTDGDGLTDEFEIKYGYPYLKPDNKDTNNNGVNDADEDSDGDDLTNIQEQQYKTLPLSADSDGDGLSDKDEIFTHKTDPLKADSDGDGVQDGREVANGSNPLVKDADKVVTSSQTQTLISANGQVNNVSVQITGAGDLGSQIVVKNLSDQKIPGQVGQSYDIGLNSGNSSNVNATITLPYDKTDSNAVDPSQLAIYTINPTTGAYEELPSTVDPSTGTVRATTNHFSPFFVANTTAFKAFLGTVPQTCDLITDPNAKPADVVLVIDSSGSMGWNDPSDIRKSAAKSFASKMKSTDRVSVVDFDDRARLAIGLSNNITSINTAIDTIDSSGGTDIGAGVSIALTQLTTNSDSTKNRAVILLTDGDGSYDTSLTTQLANAGIRVFAIGLTGSVNTTLLQGIATGTNGGYKQIQTADGLNNIFTEFASVFGDTGKDTDGDGLTDCQETQGIYLMNLGRVVKTDPTKPDTDGDGLDDGVEIGAIYRAPLAITSTVWAAQGFSNPEVGAIDTDGDGLTDYEEAAEDIKAFAKDSDGDGLTDKEEIEIGTDALNIDTDGDGFGDKEDPNPLTFDQKLTKTQYVSQFVIGYLCPGDFEICTDTFTKASGKIANTFTPFVGNVYDVLNAVANTGRGDFVAAGIDTVGVAANLGYLAGPVGVVTDTTANIIKTAKIIVRFGSKSDEAVLLSKKLIDKLPTSLVDDAVSAINPSAFTAMKNAGMSDDAIATLAKSGKVNFDNLKLALDGAKKPHITGTGFLSDWRQAEDIVRAGNPKYGKAVDVPGVGGKRYPDDFDPTTRFAKEAKNGCEDSSRVLKQIEKDAALKNAGTYKSIEWHFFPSAVSGCIGPGAKVLAALAQKGIPYIMHLP